MSPQQIVHLLRSIVIPWTAPELTTAIVMAQAKMRVSDLPEGVTLSRRKIVGQRMVTRNKRYFGNQRVYTAEWPEANLQELAIPKLACILSGTADYLLGDCYVHCGPGTFILMPPHIPHQRNAPNLAGEHLRNGSCASLHALAFQHGVHFWYSRSVNERHFNEEADNYLIPNFNAVQIISLLMNEAAERKPHFEPVASGLLATFFAIVAREIALGNYTRRGLKEDDYQPARSTPNFADQVQEYLEANCHRILKVEDVATHMYMSKSQFSRRMRQEMGVTFIELITRLRIERAQQMLRDTNLTSTGIAGSLGFRSVTHFHAVFRSLVDCTPIEYRRQAHRDASKD
jgi:AraC-like DNA-binding protein